MNTTNKSSKLWLALVCGMVCSSVLTLTGHSHAAMQPAASAQGIQTVVITAKRMTHAEKVQYQAELAQQGNLRA